MACLLDVQRSFRDAVLAGDRASAPVEIIGGTVGAAISPARCRSAIRRSSGWSARISLPLPRSISSSHRLPMLRISTNTETASPIS
jgi:hypothetical protein